MSNHNLSTETVTKILNGNTFETKENSKPVQLANVGPGHKKNQIEVLSRLILGKEVNIHLIEENAKYRIAQVHCNDYDVPINSIIDGKYLIISVEDTK
jgi:hypothetical protein